MSVPRNLVAPAFRSSHTEPARRRVWRLCISVLLYTATVAAPLAVAQPGAGSGKQAPPAPAVSVELVAPRRFEQRLVLTGDVEPTVIAELSSPAEGPVQGCRVREGDLVHAGETLLAIGRESSVTANVTAAEEELDRKRREFERFSALATRNVLAVDELDRARAELERARAALAQAHQAAADYVLKAPWAGVVARVHVADGKYVAPRTPLVDLFDPQSLVLRFQVPEAQAFAIRVGDPVAARFDAFPERAFRLAINRVYPEIDRRLRTRTFEAALPLAEAAFAPGQFARIALTLRSEDNAITVPVEAIARGADGQPVVFVVGEDGTARAVPVTPGPEQDGRVLLDRALEAVPGPGLAPGARLIVDGVEKVKPGATVRVATDGPADGSAADSPAPAAAAGTRP